MEFLFFKDNSRGILQKGKLLLALMDPWSLRNLILFEEEEQQTGIVLQDFPVLANSLKMIRLSQLIRWPSPSPAEQLDIVLPLAVMGGSEG